MNVKSGLYENLLFASSGTRPSVYDMEELAARFLTMARPRGKPMPTSSLSAFPAQVCQAGQAKVMPFLFQKVYG